MTPDKIKNLRELLAKATPGEWHADSFVERYLDDAQDFAIVTDAEGKHLLNMHDCQNYTDAQVIAALRNNAEALLDAAEENAKLKDELKDMRDQRYWQLHEEMRWAWGMQPGQKIGVDEINAFMESRHVHRDYTFAGKMDALESENQKLRELLLTLFNRRGQPVPTGLRNRVAEALK